MLKCVMMIPGDTMEIWNGNLKDSTNFESNEFLKINSCGFQNLEPGFTVIREKGRLDFQIILITDGHCIAYHDGKEYRLSAGNILIYEPNEYQEYRFNTNSTSLWCHFSGTAVREIFESCRLCGGVYHLPPEKGISDIFSTLIQRFHLNGSEKMAVPSLLELIYAVSDALYKPEKQNNSISAVLTYINANYNKQLTLKELARISGYSLSRFSHLFAEITGTTPIKYQNAIRLKLSLEMLTSTSLSVSEIAYSLGFSDPLYFSRIFKKMYGVSPSKYRKSL